MISSITRRSDDIERDYFNAETLREENEALRTLLQKAIEELQAMHETVNDYLKQDRPTAH